MGYFVILTQPRNGTHMLRTALDTHSAITCIGEVNAIGWGGMPDWVYRCREARDRAAFFSRVRQEGTSSCFGFCLHLDQLRDGYPFGDFSADFLQALPELKLVQLVRKNQLAVYASERIVQQTREWVRYTTARPRSRPRPCITIDLRSLLAWCDAQYDKWQVATWRKYFPRLTVTYESLVQQQADTLQQVQQFLDVPARPLTPGTAQLEQRPLHEVITNYARVEQALRGTRWEGCLTDDPPNWLED